MEAQTVLIVVGRHFQHQRAHFVVVSQQGKDQPISNIQLCPVKLAVAGMDQLHQLGGVEIAASDGFLDLVKSAGREGGVEACVFEDFHEL